MAVAVDRKTKLTYEDYRQFPDDGRRHEIINGDHHVSAAPSLYHQWVLTRLVVQLYHHVCEPGLGYLAPAPVDTVLSESDVVQPDIVVTLDRDEAVIRRERIEGPPDLIVEILSPSTAYRDRGLKLDLYQTAGVREYWIVDPDRRQVGSVVRWAVKTFSRNIVEKFTEVLQIKLPGAAEGLRTYAEHLREEGRQDAQVATIEGFLGAGIKWSTIKRATGIDQAAFDALRRQQRSSDRED